MVLKIGYFAHGPWGHLALRRLISDQRFEVCFVATRSVGDPVLEAISSEAGIPFFIPGRVNEDVELTRIEGYGAELFVSMSFDQIFGRRLIELPPKGVINCHAGALPFYRGRNVLNWALINGQSHFGVTIHFIVDEGIDTGPIILQDLVDIGPDEGYGDLLQKAYMQCAKTLHLALLKISEGVGSAEQVTIDPIGFYCGKRREGDEWLDWRQSSIDIHNFIRGITLPAPCARTRIADEIYAIVRSELVPGAKSYLGTPGEVVGRDQTGITVKTGDSVIRILQLAIVEIDGQLGSVGKATLSVGSRFCQWTDHRTEQLENRVRELEMIVRGSQLR
jgi:methionyl-tRNA formyltransferase